MSAPFHVRVKVRGYELDTQGHLNWAEYLHYAENARWECIAAAGITQDELLASGVGPVALNVNVSYHHELRGGDEVDVSCAFLWTGRKVFDIVQDFTRSDGTLAAKLTSKTGLIHLSERRLIADPAKHFRDLATAPDVMGL